MTPHLLNLVHVAVRSRFEGAQTYAYIRMHTKIIRMLRSKIVCSASLTHVHTLNTIYVHMCMIPCNPH